MNLNWVLFLLLNISINLHRCNSSSATDPFVQQKLDKVSQLPGQNFNVSFSHYSGYVTVNQESGRNLFYWFIEAENDPSSKPLLFWFNGGPGCSSIAYGEAEEIGPFHIKGDGKTLYLNPYSWNQEANILFIDSPVGVGYSYSKTPSDLLSNGDKRTAEDSLAFILKWLDRFPQYKGRELFITGESYAGHYVPQLSQAIVRYNLATRKEPINLKGYMVGNALTDDFHDQLGIFQFMWSAGMISDQTFKKLNLFCDFQSVIHPSAVCDKMLDIASDEMGNIDPYSIFTPPCSANVSFSNQLLKRIFVGRISEKYDPCTEKHSVVYFNLPEVQKALHVTSEAASSKWDTCSDAVSINWKDSPRTMLDIYRELIHSGLRIWIFSGDTDAVIPITSTRYSIDALKLPTVGPWRAWYDDGQVGGWTQEYAGLNFVSVRGAGHEVPLHKPKLALTLVKAFLSGTPMPNLKQVTFAWAQMQHFNILGFRKDHLERGNIDFSSLKFRVLDEADEMLRMGFVEDVELILGKVADVTKVQTLLFSATLPPWVKQIAARFQKANKKTVDLVGNEKMKASNNVRHITIPCSSSAFSQLIPDIIRCYASDGRSIVFTETRDCADQLSQALPGAKALHGEINQSQREVTLKGFRSGKFMTLVATNVAARGLDINDVQLIIQCEPPRDVEAYIHRSGRTGRAGNTGVAVMLYDPRKSNFSRIERESGVKFEYLSAPQPSDVAQASGAKAAERIIEISDSVIPVFMSAAEELLNTSGLSAVELLAKALAKATGYTELKSRSLLSSMENYVTVILEAGRPIYSPSFAFSILRRFLPEEKVESIKGFAITADGNGAVFDVAVEDLDTFLAGQNNAANVSLEVLKTLPRLQEKEQSKPRYGGGGGGGNRFSGGRGGGGRFGGGGGGGSRW